MKSTSSKTILVLGASLYQIPVILSAKNEGYRVVTADYLPDNPGHALADRCYNVSTVDCEGILDIAKLENIGGIISPSTDVAVATASYVAEKLDLVAPPFEAAKILTEKTRFRAFMESVGRWPSPEFHHIDKDENPGDVFDSKPWIIKPNRSSGSKGVRIVLSMEEYDFALAESREMSLDDTVILERYIEGHQGSVEGLLHGGEVAVSWILDRNTALPPYSATYGHRLPSILDKGIKSELLHQIGDVFKSLDVASGPFDCDFVATENEVYLLELTPRLGGNSISTLLKHACKVNLVLWAIRNAMSEEPAPFASSKITPSALILLGVQEEGLLKYDPESVDSLCKEDWCKELTMDAKPGEHVKPFIDGRRRVGEAILCASSPEKLESRIEEFHHRLGLEVNR